MYENIMFTNFGCRFVGGWVKLYYNDDQEVQRDSELQSWIQEIHIEGFRGFTHTGKSLNLITVIRDSLSRICHNYQGPLV